MAGIYKLDITETEADLKQRLRNQSHRACVAAFQMRVAMATAEDPRCVAVIDTSAVRSDDEGSNCFHILEALSVAGL